MEQWQSCLAPACQAALTRAHQTVSERGGEVITPEDLLLAILDVDTELAPFLARWGVDLDELIRTIQCEQPLSAPAAMESGLSDCLIDWLACARERYTSPWLSAWHLLSTLVAGAERFQNKAYVAVLEQVPGPAWEALSMAPVLPGPVSHKQEVVPEREWVRSLEQVTISGFPLSSSTHELATDLVTRLMEPVGGLVWLKTSANSRVAGLLGQVRRMARAVSSSEGITAGAVHTQTPQRRWYQVDWERSGENDAALDNLFAAVKSHCHGRGPVVFLFQDCSPAVLMLFIQRIGVLKWRHLLAIAKPVIMLTSSALKHTQAPAAWLEDSLGLELKQFAVPLLSVEECLRYLRFCQPGMERKWQIEIADSALRAAACLARATQQVIPAHDAAGQEPSSHPESDPEAALGLLQEALNSKITQQANGTARLAELRARQEDLERRCLLAGAREDASDGLASAYKSACLELAAEEVFWREHGTAVPSVLMHDDVVRQALRRSGVPLVSPGERIRETLPDLETLSDAGDRPGLETPRNLSVLAKLDRAPATDRQKQGVTPISP